jgi:hypothetical protein
MASFGDYKKQTFQNGVTTVNPTTFQPMEDKIENIDNELAHSSNYRFEDLKKYFWMRNCKEINMFDDYTDWTGVGANVDNTNGAYTGNNDVYFADSDDTGSTIYMHDTVTSIDLTKFNDESASTTADVICLSVFLSDYTFFNDLILKLGTDSGNYYSYTFTLTESSRVTFQAKKSAFNTTGTPAGWDDITYIHIETVTEDNASSEFIACQALMMYRNDPVTDGQGQPFQNYSGSSWSNFFTQSTSLWNLFFDPAINDLGIQLLNDSNDTGIYNGIKIRSSVISFNFKSIMYTNVNSYTNNMTWYVAADNYATAWIDNDDFTLLINEAGVPTDYTFTLNTTLSQGERLEIILEKNIDTIRATLIKGNDRIAIHEHETTIDSETEGDLYFGFDDAGLCFIPDFIISNVSNLDLNSWDKPKVVIKQADESTSEDTTLSNDAELYAYLPPNSMFRIEAIIMYYSASATPDLKCDFATGGDDKVTDKISIGPATTNSSTIDTNVIMKTNGIGGDVSYGADGSLISCIYEEFIIKSGVNGNLINFRWAQNVSNATAITIKAGSHLIITKVDLLQQNN